MRREPFAGGVVGAFGLALGLGVSGAPGDGRHSRGRQVEPGAGQQAPAVGWIAPGVVEGLNPWKDEDHARTQEVPR